MSETDRDMGRAVHRNKATKRARLAAGAGALGALALLAGPGPAGAQTREAGTAGGGACRIAVLGDSLTAGYGLAPGEGFPAQLERALRAAGIGCAVTDAGVSGDTSAGGLARTDWTLADRPSHVIVELGANDALRALPPATTEANLEGILDKTRAAGVPTLVAGMLAPPNLGPAYGREFAAVFPRVAERYDAALYPFFLEGVAADPNLNQRDGIHPTKEGIAVIVRRILPTVTAWLDATGAGGASPPG